MDSSTRHRRRGARAVAGVGVALLLAGCGFNAQTLQPYTPAHGVNADADTIKVRNLLVVADEGGSGIVSASLLSTETDRLTAVSGRPIKADGTAGAPLTVTTGSQVALSPNQLLVLTAPTPVVTVTSPDLQPGLTAELALTFESGTTIQATAPVMSFDSPIYATVTPTPAAPSASAEPTATPPASAEPTPTTAP